MNGGKFWKIIVTWRGDNLFANRYDESTLLNFNETNK